MRCEPIQQVSIILTSKCNLRCIMCRYWCSEPREMPLKTFRDIVDDIARAHVPAVQLTGGEPTLHSQFDQALELSSQAELEITLVTNGTQDVATYLSRLTRLIVSLDSWNPEIYRQIRGVGQEEVLKNLRRALTMTDRPHTTVCTVINALTCDHLYDFLTQSVAEGVDKISFLSLELPGFRSPGDRGFSFGRRASLPGDKLIPSSQQLQRLASETVPRVNEFIRSHPQFDNASVRQLPAVIDFYSRYTGGCEFPSQDLCGFPLKEMVVTEVCAVKPCFFLPIEWPYEKGFDFNNDSRVKAFREQYSGELGYRELNCSGCFQTIHGKVNS